MSGIVKASHQMKKKISFGDYFAHPNPATPSARKVYALSHEDGKKIQEIFLKRADSPNQTSKAEIVSEAIGLLYRLEVNTILEK